MSKNQQHKCENCMFVQRPFGKVLDDSHHCKKIKRFVNLTDGESCQFFKLFNEEDWRMKSMGI